MAKKPESIATRKDEELIEKASKRVGKLSRELREAVAEGDDKRAKRIRQKLSDMTREITGG